MPVIGNLHDESADEDRLGVDMADRPYNVLFTVHRQLRTQHPRRSPDEPVWSGSVPRIQCGQPSQGPGPSDCASFARADEIPD